MENTTNTRALQHLLVQGFTLYTAEAATSMLLGGSTTLADPAHAWAVEFDASSWKHTDTLLGNVPEAVYQVFAAAAETCKQQQTSGVLTHTQGASLFSRLLPADVAGVRMKIETAVILGKQPPTEKLEAFGDEAIQREAKRRGLLPKTPDRAERVAPS
jgi:hypothetical protein